MQNIMLLIFIIGNIILGNNAWASSPAADFIAIPDSGSAPLNSTLDASASNDMDGFIRSYTWTIDGAPIALGTDTTDYKVTGASIDSVNGVTVTRRTMDLTFKNNGTYLVSLTVTDDSGQQSNSIQKNINVGNTNATPVASFTLTPISGPAPLKVTLDYSNSHDPDGQIVKYEWSVDGQPIAPPTGPGSTKEMNFNNPGTYVIGLTVTDDDGLTDSTQHSVTIDEEATTEPPVAKFTLTPSSGSAPLKVTLDYSDSYDPDGQIVKYEWSVDGQAIGFPTGPGSTKEMNFSNPGTYVIGLTVTDDSGLTDSAQQGVTVEDSSDPPVAAFTITPNSGSAPLEISLDYSDSYDPDGKIIDHAWEVNGQPIAPSTTASSTDKMTFHNPGTYIISLTVTDDDGLSHSAQNSIQVTENTQTARLINISANAQVPVIGGFGIEGTGSLSVMLRGMGVQNCIDPLMILQKYPSGDEIDRNDDWSDHSSADQIRLLAQHLKLSKTADAGMLVSLPVGYYTVSVGSVGCTDGNAVVGVDALEDEGSAYLINISANGPVPVIGGFGIKGIGSLPLMLRGLRVDECVDPSLSLQKYPEGTYANSNDDWQNHPSASKIRALPKHLQPQQATDSGAFLDIEARYYTVTVNSNGCQGNAVVGIDFVK